MYMFISVIHFSAIPSYPQVLTLVFSMDCSRAWQPPIEKPVKNGGLDGWFRFEFWGSILGVMAWRFQPLVRFFGVRKSDVSGGISVVKKIVEICSTKFVLHCSNGWIKKYSRHACSCPMSSWKWHRKKHSPITAIAFLCTSLHHLGQLKCVWHSLVTSWILPNSKG